MKMISTQFLILIQFYRFLKFFGQRKFCWVYGSVAIVSRVEIVIDLVTLDLFLGESLFDALGDSPIPVTWASGERIISIGRPGRKYRPPTKGILTLPRITIIPK